MPNNEYSNYEYSVFVYRVLSSRIFNTSILVENTDYHIQSLEYLSAYYQVLTWSYSSDSRESPIIQKHSTHRFFGSYSIAYSSQGNDPQYKMILDNRHTVYALIQNESRVTHDAHNTQKTI